MFRPNAERLQPNFVHNQGGLSERPLRPSIEQSFQRREALEAETEGIRERVAGLHFVLARRAHKGEGPIGQAPSCARASLTQDSLVPGLGGWSDRRTRALGGSLAATP